MGLTQQSANSIHDSLIELGLLLPDYRQLGSNRELAGIRTSEMSPMAM
jgi:hypothetical protein